MRTNFRKALRFGKDNFRCIVFVQQRLSACVVADFLKQAKHLQDVGLSACFVTAVGKITPSINMTRTGSQKVMENFRAGKFDILVATAAAEEVSTNKRNLIG